LKKKLSWLYNGLVVSKAHTREVEDVLADELSIQKKETIEKLEKMWENRTKNNYTDGMYRYILDQAIKSIK